MSRHATFLHMFCERLVVDHLQPRGDNQERQCALVRMSVPVVWFLFASFPFLGRGGRRIIFIQLHSNPVCLVSSTGARTWFARTRHAPCAGALSSECHAFLVIVDRARGADTLGTKKKKQKPNQVPALNEYKGKVSSGGGGASEE